jgi:peptide chain release factor subunit 1
MQLLTQELSGAESIKSRQTRQSVISAITSSRERLKLYKNTPKNGLCVFCGVILMEDGKTEKKITIALEPFKPINVFAYKCQNSFYTEPLLSLLEDDDKFGFVIIDGNGILFATLQGNNKEVIQRMPVQLPKKHGRGGQSAMRFARLREEKRHTYIVKCCEMAKQHFIADDKLTVRGIVIAGSADLKFVMQQSDHFDQRLRSIVIATVDVSYGQDQGFNQAITLAADSLASVKFVQEKKVIGRFFEEIALDSGMITFGVQDTIKAMELGALETMMLFENIEVMRYEIKNPVSGEVKVHLLNAQQEQDPKYFKDAESGVDLEVVSSESLADWLCLNYKSYGIQIEFITDKSPDGFQFVKGFGGIGGFLRYRIELDDVIGDANGNYDEDFDPDEDFI